MTNEQQAEINKINKEIRITYGVCPKGDRWWSNQTVIVPAGTDAEQHAGVQSAVVFIAGQVTLQVDGGKP